MPKPIDNLLIDGEKLDARVEANLTPASELLLSMNGASTLTLAVDDPNRDLLESGVLARTRRGKITKGLELSPWQRLGKVQLSLEGTFWRLAGVQISGPITSLTWEQEIVARLRAHTRYVREVRLAGHGNSGELTRAQFISGLILTVRHPPVLARIFDEEKAQPIKDTDTSSPKVAKKGIPSTSHVQIKGVQATREQIRQMNLALKTAEKEGAGERATLALIVAGIGESAFTTVVNSIGYGGVFQGDVSHRYRYFKATDTELQAHFFLRGGKGFQGGGAMKLARENPDMTPGTIATTVEASGQPGSFYDAYRDEADKILDAYGGTSRVVSTRKQSVYTAGTKKDASADEKEDYFESALRLAREVNWRFFATTQGPNAAAGDMFVFGNDLHLIAAQPSYTLAEQFERGDPRGTFQVGMFDSGDWHYNKPAGNLAFRAPLPDRWFAAPGQVADVLRMGPFTGRWLTFEVRQPLDAFDADFTLARPSPPKPEPEGDKVTTQSLDPEQGGAARDRIIAACENANKHESALQYSMTRPYPDSLFSGPTPRLVDCSSFCILIYKAAGVTDPAGLEYNGNGFTGTLWARGTRTDRPQPGDLCFYGSPNSPGGDAHVNVYAGKEGGQDMSWNFGRAGVNKLQTRSVRNDFVGFKSFDLSDRA